MIRVGKRTEEPEQVEIWSVDVGEPPPEGGSNGSVGRKRTIETLEGVERFFFNFDVLPDGPIVWNRVERERPELWIADLQAGS